MKIIEKIIARHHKCKESDVTITDPTEIPEVEETTTIEIEYEINGTKNKIKFTLTPPIIVS